MKPLDSKANAIFQILIEGLKQPGDARKIDHSEGTFMPVDIDFVWQNEHGRIFAIAHHYIQNGDSMHDPDMTFLVTENSIYPMTFQQDNPGIYQVAIEALDGKPIKCHAKLQTDLTLFANDWMRNIKEQQNLKLPSLPKPQPSNTPSDLSL